LAQKQKAPGKKNKTVLTLTGLLMEGLGTGEVPLSVMEISAIARC
jgi:hypothetical protein